MKNTNSFLWIGSHKKVLNKENKNEIVYKITIIIIRIIVIIKRKVKTKYVK